MVQHAARTHLRLVGEPPHHRINGTPLETLQLLAAQAPDVAVLDIGLPDMDGYALAARIQNLLPGGGVRLIALTGYGQEQDRQRSAAAGFAQHLVKPVNLEQLLELVGAP